MVNTIFSIQKATAQSCATCTFTTSFYSSGALQPPLSTSITNNVTCNQTIDVVLQKICNPSNAILNITASLYDANNVTPAWANIPSLNNNLFIIPANVTGAFSLKYVWKMPGSNTICGTIIYPINITCTTIPPVCNLVVTGIPNCNSATTATNSINATATGGIAPYTYSWNTTPAQTTASLLNVMPGSYSVTVTDALGCSKTQPLSVNCNLNLPTPFCEGPDGFQLSYDFSLPTGTPLISYKIKLEVYQNGNLINCPTSTELIKTSPLNFTSYTGNIVWYVSTPICSQFTGSRCLDYRIIITKEGPITPIVVQTIGGFGAEGTIAGVDNDLCCTPPPSCCPTVSTALANLGGHCGIQDTIRNNCNKNISSWTLKVNGSIYNVSGYPLTPQAIAANSTAITGIVSLVGYPLTTIPMVYTFTYADGTTCTVTKQFNMATCVPTSCPFCSVTTMATLQGQTTSINLSNSTLSNPTTLKCNSTYALNNIVGCSPIQTYVFDANYATILNNTTTTLLTGITNATGTQLLLPNNMNAANSYTLKFRWYWLRGAGDTCFFVRNYPFKIDCTPCGTVCIPMITATSATTTQMLGGLVSSGTYNCNTNYTFTVNLGCSPANGIIVKQIKVLDALNNFVVVPWITGPTSNVVNVNIPSATSGVYKIRFYKGTTTGPICDSFLTVLNISCTPPPPPPCFSNELIISTGANPQIFPPGSNILPQDNDWVGVGTSPQKIMTLGALPYYGTTGTGNAGILNQNESQIANIPFFTTYRNFYVCNNGNISFSGILGIEKVNLTTWGTLFRSFKLYKGTSNLVWSHVSTTAGTTGNFVTNNFTGTIAVTPGQYRFVFEYEKAGTDLYRNLAFVSCKLTGNSLTNSSSCCPPPPDCNFIANAGPDKTICQGTSTTIGTAILTTNGETYTWTSNPASTIPNTSMPTVSPTVTTTYTLTVTKPNCPTKTDDVVVTVNNCCNCQTANCTAKYFYKNAAGGNVALACGQTIQLECNKVYPFVATTNCQNNCTATVNADLYKAGVLVQSYPIINNTNFANITFTTSGNYTLVYRLLVNGVECDKCPIKINVNCPPPTCNPCNVAVTSTTKYWLANNDVEKMSALIQSFNFSGLPANITEVRAVVTDVKIFAVDLNGNANEECLSCNNNPITWASIIGGDPISNIKPTVNVNGTELMPPLSSPQISVNSNPRQVTWKNGGIFTVTNPIKLSFVLPPFSVLSCCTRKATICVKFIFRNDKCEECVVRKCFDVELK